MGPLAYRSDSSLKILYYRIIFTNQYQMSIFEAGYFPYAMNGLIGVSVEKEKIKSAGKKNMNEPRRKDHH